MNNLLNFSLLTGGTSEQKAYYVSVNVINRYNKNIILYFKFNGTLEDKEIMQGGSGRIEKMITSSFPLPPITMTASDEQGRTVFLREQSGSSSSDVEVPFSEGRETKSYFAEASEGSKYM